MVRLIIGVVLTRQQAYSLALALSENACFTNCVRWSAKASGTLCLAIARLIKVSALITLSFYLVELDDV